MLLGLITTLIVVRFDFTGIQSRQDVNRLTTFLRARQAAVLRTGVKRTVRLRSSPLRFSVSIPGSEGSRSLSLAGWSLVRPDDPAPVHLTPSGARGFAPVTLRHEDGHRVTLKPHRMLVYRPERTRDD